MILVARRHGRSPRDVRYLASHLAKTHGQTSRVVSIGNCPLTEPNDAMRYMQAMRDGSHARVAMHHIAISPRNRLTDTQRDDVIRRILTAFDAEDHAYVVWEHDEKFRSDPRVSDQHYHLILSHVGPDCRALNDAMSFDRLEAIARSAEVDFGEPLTVGRRTANVAKILRDMGRSDVAELLVPPHEPPQSAMTSNRHQIAARQEIDLPKAQAAIRASWLASETVFAFKAALSELGFDISKGKKANVFMVVQGDAEIGALDRIVREKRKMVAERLSTDAVIPNGREEIQDNNAETDDPVFPAGGGLAVKMPVRMEIGENDHVRSFHAKPSPAEDSVDVGHPQDHPRGGAGVSANEDQGRGGDRPPDDGAGRRSTGPDRGPQGDFGFRSGAFVGAGGPDGPHPGDPRKARARRRVAHAKGIRKMRDANFSELSEKARSDIERVRGTLSQRRDAIARRLKSLQQPLPEPPELAFARYRLAITQKASSEGYDASRRAELALHAIQEPFGWRRWLPWIRADHRRRTDAARDALRQAKEDWLSAADQRRDAQAEVDRQVKKLNAIQNRYAEECLAEKSRLHAAVALIEEAENVLCLRPEIARRGVDEVLATAAEQLHVEQICRQEAVDREQERQRQEEFAQQALEPPILP